MTLEVLTQLTPLETVVILGESLFVVIRSNALRTAGYQDAWGSNKRESLVGIVG